MALFLTSIVTISLVFVLDTPIQATPTFDSPLPPPDSEDPYDFETDSDGDGIPDELEEALAELDDLAENAQSDAAAQAHYENALRRFEKRLPYRPQTRGVQARIRAAYQRVLHANNQKVIDAALEEIKELDALLADDPNLALVDSIFDHRFNEAWRAKIAEGRSSRFEEESVLPDSIEQVGGGDNIWRVFLVFVSGEGLDACTSNSAPAYNQLAVGDIMLFSGSSKINNFIYAKKFTHAGIYNGISNNVREVYESNVGPTPGARIVALSAWQIAGTCIALGRTNNTTPDQRLNALNWAKTEYGVDGSTPYNYNLLDKNTDAKLYCSQLVWKAQQHIGVNVDSDSAIYRNWLVAHYGTLIGEWGEIAASTAAYLAVAPDEIALDGDVVFYSEGKN